MFDVLNILMLSWVTFCIGVFGIHINRHNVLILLMSVEIIYIASSINFSYSCFSSGDMGGALIIIYILAIAGAESCIGLAIISLYYAVHRDVSLNTMDLLRR